MHSDPALGPLLNSRALSDSTISQLNDGAAHILLPFLFPSALSHALEPIFYTLAISLFYLIYGDRSK